MVYIPVLEALSPFLSTSFYIQVTMSDILHISCWVLGDDLRSAFIVHIGKSMFVDTLKEAIKARKLAFKDMDAGGLRIWKVGVCHRCESYTFTQRCARCLFYLLNWLG
jgi:hypothetical protein